MNFTKLISEQHFFVYNNPELLLPKSTQILDLTRVQKQPLEVFH